MFEDERKFHVYVLGNIGSGKSSILDRIQKFGDMVVEDEPMEKWENVNKMNLLQTFYEDKKRWSFAFQTKVLLTLR